MKFYEAFQIFCLGGMSMKHLCPQTNIAHAYFSGREHLLGSVHGLQAPRTLVRTPECHTTHGTPLLVIQRRHLVATVIARRARHTQCRVITKFGKRK